MDSLALAITGYNGIEREKGLLRKSTDQKVVDSISAGRAK